MCVAAAPTATDDGQSASTFSGDASVFIPTDTTRLQYAAGLLKKVRGGWSYLREGATQGKRTAPWLKTM